MDTVAARYTRIRYEIDEAAIKSGRKPDDVRLVVVTKGQPVSAIVEVIEAGGKILGENYPEQALPKIITLQEYTGIEWHMIGHLQSRKASIVCNHFHMMHSLDSLSIAQRIQKELEKIGKDLPVLLEINIGQETTKSGWAVGDQEEMELLINDVSAISKLTQIRIVGLMAMPPLVEDKEIALKNFLKVMVTRKVLQDRFPDLDWREVSMGTSLDYIQAIQAGATMVRIGTAILGPRNYQKN